MGRSFTDWVDDVGISYNNLRILRKQKSRFNSIIIAQSKTLGKILIIDGEVQHVEAWEFLYHEPLIHLPTAFIATPKKALIIGGGSLNALREVLKYRSVEEISLVEIDRKVIELMIRINPGLKKLIKDRKVNILYEDGYKYLLKTKEMYDLIINDGADLTRVSHRQNIVKVMFDHLTKVGVCADVVYRHLFEKRTTKQMLSLLKEIKGTIFSLIFVPEYPGMLHLLTLWGKNDGLTQNLKKPKNIEQMQWESKNFTPCKYYDPKHFEYFLYIPNYIRELISKLSEKPFLKT